MFYPFPIINNINDVLPAIEGASEFLVADRGDHTVLNYVVMTPDSFPPVKVAGGSAKQRAERSLNNALRRECRGMIFDNATGAILRRPYHKFFNLNQIDETHINKIDLTQPHDIIEKLDGSMIVPYRVNRRVIWGTKMGDTDVCTPVEAFVKLHPEYLRFFQRCEASNISPIFEWMSRVNRIVIDHPEDRLVLTAMRTITHGGYMSHKFITDSAALDGIPAVERFHVGEHTSIEDIMDYIRAQEGTEGVVIRFDNGHMIKIKSEWYCAIHGAKELITEEKNVVRLIVEEAIDDAKALVLEEDRENLTRYERDFWSKVNDFAREMTASIIVARKMFKTRKDFALRKDKGIHEVEVAVFRFFDNEVNPTLQEVRQHVIDRIIKPNVNNRTKFTAMKQIVFPGLRQYL